MRSPDQPDNLTCVIGGKYIKETQHVICLIIELLLTSLVLLSTAGLGDSSLPLNACVYLKTPDTFVCVSQSGKTNGDNDITE